MGRLKIISAANGIAGTGGGGTGVITVPAGGFVQDTAVFSQRIEGAEVFEVFQFSATEDQSVVLTLPNDGQIKTSDFALKLALSSETDEATDNVVKFKAEAVFVGSGDELEETYGTAVEFTGTLSDASTLAFAESAKITAANSRSMDGGALRVKLTRMATDVADTLDQTASLFYAALSINQ